MRYEHKTRKNKSNEDSESTEEDGETRDVVSAEKESVTGDAVTVTNTDRRRGSKREHINMSVDDDEEDSDFNSQTLIDAAESKRRLDEHLANVRPNK